MPTITLLTLAIASSVSQSTGTGTAAPACNNLTRTLAIAAGTTPAVTQNCPQITVSVAGSSFSTPASCIVAYTHYLESVWTCGPAATGLHCNAQGSQATHKNYTGGACPSVAGLTSGMSWGSWADVPANLVAIIQGMSSCVPPTESSEWDYSASVSNCKTVTGSGNLTSGGSGSGWFGHPGELILDIERYNPFATQYEAAAERGAHSPQAQLRAVSDAFAAVGAAQVEVEVTVEHFDAGVDTPRNVNFSIHRGVVTDSGLFDITRTSTSTNAGERAIFDTRRVFDGELLREQTLTSGEGNAYSKAYADANRLWQMEVLPELRPLYTWIRNPYQIARFADQTFVEAPHGEATLVQLIQSGPSGRFVGKEYVVAPDARDVPVVTSTRILDEFGRPCETSSFSDFREIAPNVWRPFDVDSQILLDREPHGARVRIHLRFRQAQPMAPQEATAAVLGAEFSNTVEWNVWQ